MTIYNNPNIRGIGNVHATDRNYQVRRVDPLKKADAPVRADRVDLSKEGQWFHAIREQLARVPDVRLEKVNALKQAIADGTYRVDAEQIADAMLQEGKKFS